MGAPKSSTLARPTGANPEVSPAAKQIENITSQLRKVSDARSVAEQRRAELASERSGLIHRAIVDSDAGAAQRIAEIDVQLMKLDRNLADNATAIEALNWNLKEAEQQRERIDWESERAKVRKALLTRISAAKRGTLKAAADAFASELQKAKEADAAISDLLLRFDLSFKPEARVLQAAHARRQDILKLRLFEALRIEEPRWGLAHASNSDLEVIDCQPLEQALRELDRLEYV